MKKIVMIGPSPTSHGGMASVISTLLKAGYLTHKKHVFIATQIDGSGLQKLALAIRALTKFSLLLLTGRVEILHAHIASGASFWRKAAFIWLANLAGCPVIFHLHGGKFRQFIETQSPLLQKISTKLIRNSSLCLTLTSEAEKWLHEVIKVNKVEAFPNPILLGPNKPREASLDILFLGRIEESKGIPDLLHAFSTIKRKHPEARLIIGGEGDKESAINLSKELGILDSTVFTGWLNEEMRTYWLNRSAVFALPSLAEQMPISILEAMAAGTPVVATRVGAIADMLEEGACGIIIPPREPLYLAEAIDSILSSPEMSASLSRKALDKVHSDYSADNVINRLTEHYSRTKKTSNNQ